jgi:hypothetical protein
MAGETPNDFIPAQTTSGHLHCAMMSALAIAIGLTLVGCGPPPPVPKAKHVQQIQRVVAAVGVTNIINESRTLFTRFSHETNVSAGPDSMTGSRYFAGLSGLTNLGDVFTYESYQPDRIEIRIYNSHFDTYFIALLNPDKPDPAGFERIAGNVGFIEPDGAANRGQPVHSDTNQASSSAGPGR